MALDKLVDSTQLDADLTSVANAIRTKGGTSGSLAFPAGFVSAIGNIPSGGGSGMQLELIGQTTISLSEYTDTTTAEQTDTGINISNTDYAYGFVVITCDTAITTSSEWGMTIANFGRYTSNGNLICGISLQQKGAATLSKAAMVSVSLSQNSYGVVVISNTSTVIISRKCHGTGCPKCRAGNYTIAVYGVKTL